MVILEGGEDFVWLLMIIELRGNGFIGEWERGGKMGLGFNQVMVDDQ